MGLELREPVYEEPRFKPLPFVIALVILALAGFAISAVYFGVIDRQSTIIEQWDLEEPSEFEVVGSVIVNGTIYLDDYLGNSWTVYLHQRVKFNSLHQCRELLRTGLEETSMYSGPILKTAYRFAEVPYSIQYSGSVINMFDGFTFVLNAIAISPGNECRMTTVCICDTDGDRIMDTECDYGEYLNYQGFLMNTAFFDEDLFRLDDTYCRNAIEERHVIYSRTRSLYEIFCLSLPPAEIVFAFFGLIFSKILTFRVKGGESSVGSVSSGASSGGGGSLSRMEMATLGPSGASANPSSSAFSPPSYQTAQTL